MTSKAAAAQPSRQDRANSLSEDDELPSYQDATPRADPSALQQHSTTSVATPIGPTISSPFNFPTANDVPPPDYTSSRPIAIPQQFPQATAPFLPAYAPMLLNHGILASSWYSFVETTSAFLTAKVGKRAISHAGEVAASIGRVPKQLGKDVANHVKDTFREVGHAAKSGNPFRMLGGVVGGTIGLTVGTAAKFVGSTMSLPGTAIAATASPKTPKERAEAYLLAANKDWFHNRLLHAELLNTVELARLLNVTPQQMLDAVNAQSTTAEDQMNALRDLIEGVELRNASPNTQTASIVPAPAPAPAPSPAGFPADVKQRPEIAHSDSAASSIVASSSKALAKPTQALPISLQLSAETLWLVLRRDAPPTVPKKPGT
jgi:hypothetical protein